jgi:carbamoyl-phosphate synthase/aspartate carbamoyltransferase/dihydroorotase
MRAKHYEAWPDTRLIAVHAEGETVCDILELVRQYRKHTHFLHISTAEEIDYLRAAKAEGLPITIGVCPHHLFLTEDDEKQLGAFGRMKPSLKTSNDVAALWQALDDGLVDIVESDHAPHTIAEKESETPPYGVPGLETTLPLMLTAAQAGRLSLERVIDLLAEAPRRIWGLTCPPETYALVELEASYTIERANLHGASGWSPFEGMTVIGKVVGTWIRGTQVYDGELVTVQPGFGQNLFEGH